MLAFISGTVQLFVFLLEKTFREIVNLPSAICILKISFPELQSKLVNFIRKHTFFPPGNQHVAILRTENGNRAGGWRKAVTLWALGGVGGQQSWLFL